MRAKTFLGSLLLLAAFSGLAPVVSATNVVITSDDVMTWLNVRQEPDVQSRVVGRLEINAIAELLDEGTEFWYRVRLSDGTEGFVHKGWSEPLKGELVDKKVSCVLTVSKIYGYLLGTEAAAEVKMLQILRGEGRPILQSDIETLKQKARTDNDYNARASFVESLFLYWPSENRGSANEQCKAWTHYARKQLGARAHRFGRSTRSDDGNFIWKYNPRNGARKRLYQVPVPYPQIRRIVKLGIMTGANPEFRFLLRAARGAVRF